MEHLNKLEFVDGKLIIHNDNAVMNNGITTTTIKKTSKFVIDGEDLLQLYAVLQDRECNVIETSHGRCHFKFIVVGENSNANGIAVICKRALDSIEEFNNTRHWWERKIKIKESV